jgi:hypothetical protein
MSKNLGAGASERGSKPGKMRGLLTITASTMMAQASCGPQGEMSHGAVEKGESEHLNRGIAESRDPSTAQVLHFVHTFAPLWMTGLRGQSMARSFKKNPASVEAGLVQESPNPRT